MRNRLLLSLAVLAFAACDRLSSPSVRDAGVDSLASLWEPIDAGTVNFSAVSGSAPDNVFIVGDLGTILHWDGTSLLPEASGTTANLRGVTVPSTTVAYAVGEQGTILRRQDGLWSVEASPTTAVLNAVALRATTAVAVGEQGTILSNAPGAWREVTNQHTDNYYAVTDSNEGILVAGALGSIVRVDADAGTIVGEPTPVCVNPSPTCPSYPKVLAGAARYSSGALLVGVDGGFFYWANDSGLFLEGLPQKFLRAISFVERTAWIVGHEGLVAKKPEYGSVSLVPAPDERWLTGVYAAASNDVWVVGRSGLIMRGPPGERDGGVP